MGRKEKIHGRNHQLFEIFKLLGLVIELTHG